ncbi:ATP synthase subunit I [Halothece sp. PCC 7418]
MSTQSSPPETTETPTPDSASENQPSDRGMTEYYQLQRNLYLVMLVITGVIFVSVWVAYSGQTALNYLLGALAGLLYFRRLARDIEGLGVQQGRMGFGSGRLAIFVAVIVLASQLQRLAILPVFLGFMTYKAAIVIYVVQTTLFPQRE